MFDDNIIISNISNLLKEEFDNKEVELTEKFVRAQLRSKEFNIEFNKAKEKLNNDKSRERDELICLYMLIGLGRDRTIKLTKEYKTNRTIFEKVRNVTGLNSNLLKEKNERKISNFKLMSTKRRRRLNTIKKAKCNWNELKDKYIKGSSVVSLSKEYNLTPHLIKEQLKDEKVYDENRSTLTKKSKADEKYKQIDDRFIIDLVKNNPLDSKDVWWDKAKKKYPWLLRRQLFAKLKELGLERSDDEINAIRKIKSQTMSNTDYAIKVKSYRAVNEVFGSIDSLVEKYMDNKLGSYKKISDKVSKENSFKFDVSVKQIEKIITSHPKYRPRKSAGQQQLFEFIKENFKNLEVVEEYSFDESNRRIDVYIPSLKVGIEFNGDYWHSDTVISHNYNLTAREFHEKRVKDAKRQGIRLLYVWENDWNNNYEEVEKSILNLDWNSPILNKYESELSFPRIPPSKLPGKLRFEIMNFLRHNEIEYKRKNNKSIIEIPNHNLIINVPGYSSLSDKKENIELQKECESKGIELLTFLPWIEFKKVVDFLSYRLKLKTIQKVPARKCEIVWNNKITSEQKEFFNDNHLLGYSRNFSNIDKTVTLKHNGKIVIAALFTRKKNSNMAELKRLVSAYGIAVQGGASRVIKEYVRQTKDIEKIMTFSDCDLGFGSVYKTLGFKQVFRSGPQLTWFNEELNIKFSNLSLVTVGADRLLESIPNYHKVGIGKDLPSNEEIVQEYGFVPIYDTGYKKWLLKVK